MQKRWIETPITDYSRFIIFRTQFNNFCVQKGKEPLSDSLLEILFKRGIDTIEKANDFFRPSLTQLHNPFLMTDMDKAVKRIKKAILQQEKILVYGDYDVDGTTAVALVYSFFKKYHSLIDFYIPNRYTEGYGISIQGIDYAYNQNIKLIIALDCGIKSTEQVAYANNLGIDFIICDHHLPDINLPQAIAVLDPKRSDCTYPYKELSGCGVGFKLLQAFALWENISFSELETHLELLAISIASDIVPLTGENRVLAYWGLQKLNQNPSIGIKILMELADKKDNYTISDVVFKIGPRINAAGRIDDARHSVALMIADNEIIAREKGDFINNKNAERREYDSLITEEALAIINADKVLQQKKTTVIYGEYWHKGVIGIVASRLIETYYRPTIVFTKSNGCLTGSARSVIGFDLYEALVACKHLLEQFGGHKYAAGLTIKSENLAVFQQCFENVVADTITNELLIPEVVIDAEILLTQITPKFYRLIQQFSPFGPDNMNPVFCSKNVLVIDAIIVGKNHLKLTLRQHDSKIFNAIGFGLGDVLPQILNQAQVNICYTVEENIWRELKTLQLNIKDIRVADIP